MFGDCPFHCLHALLGCQIGRARAEERVWLDYASDSAAAERSEINADHARETPLPFVVAAYLLLDHEKRLSIFSGP
jgi:hypothetical protein